MKNTDLDMQIKDILNKRTYSNDNYAKSDMAGFKQIPLNEKSISVVGNNNIIINGNLLYMTFVFLIAFAWLCLTK